MKRKTKKRTYGGAIHLRLEPDIKAILESHANALGISLSAYVRLMIEQSAATPLKLNRNRVREAM